MDASFTLDAGVYPKAPYEDACALTGAANEVHAGANPSQPGFFDLPPINGGGAGAAGDSFGIFDDGQGANSDFDMAAVYAGLGITRAGSYGIAFPMPAPETEVVAGGDGPVMAAAAPNNPHALNAQMPEASANANPGNAANANAQANGKAQRNAKGKGKGKAKPAKRRANDSDSDSDDDSDGDGDAGPGAGDEIVGEDEAARKARAEAKRKDRIMRNRQAAKKSRYRKKEYVDQLEDEMFEMKQKLQKELQKVQNLSVMSHEKDKQITHLRAQVDDVVALRMDLARQAARSELLEKQINFYHDELRLGVGAGPKI